MCAVQGRWPVWRRLTQPGAWVGPGALVTGSIGNIQKMQQTRPSCSKRYNNASLGVGADWTPPTPTQSPSSTALTSKHKHASPSSTNAQAHTPGIAHDVLGIVLIIAQIDRIRCSRDAHEGLTRTRTHARSQQQQCSLPSSSRSSRRWPRLPPPRAGTTRSAPSKCLAVAGGSLHAALTRHVQLLPDQRLRWQPARRELHRGLGQARRWLGRLDRR